MKLLSKLGLSESLAGSKELGPGRDGIERLPAMVATEGSPEPRASRRSRAESRNEWDNIAKLDTQVGPESRCRGVALQEHGSHLRSIARVRALL